MLHEGHPYYPLDRFLYRLLEHTELARTTLLILLSACLLYLCRSWIPPFKIVKSLLVWLRNIALGIGFLYSSGYYTVYPWKFVLEEMPIIVSLIFCMCVGFVAIFVALGFLALLINSWLPTDVVEWLDPNFKLRSRK